MIAVVKGCRAAFSALLFLILPAARAADDLGSAARELARKTAALGRVDLQSIVWRNVSALGPSDLAQARAAFESALQEAWARNAGGQPITARITLSQNPNQYLLVEEAQAGEERQVWIAAWKRTGNARNPVPGMSLQGKLVLEQDDPILDLAYIGEALLVLSPARVTLNAPAGAQSAALSPVKPWPRDLRGHLRVKGDTFQVFLPGMNCAGSVTPSIHMDCRNADEPWVLESGSRSILLANMPSRNYFDGRVVTQSGARKNIGAFFSAAAVEEQGRISWVLTMLDGRAQVFDAAFDSQGSFTQWGSDIAAVEAPCAAGSVVIASRTGDGSEPDAIQAFALANGAPSALTAPFSFAGPVTALWPLGAASVAAVARDLSTGKYDAYVIRLACGS
jgi:hypothetical protein